jgi:lipopolysaccharide exporter
MRRSELGELFSLPQQPFMRRTARGAAWMFVLRIFEKLLTLARTLVVAHFLSPHDFGVFAVVLIAVSALELFNVNGMRAALLQKQDESRRDLDTVWSVFLLQNCVNAGLLLLVAEPLARFFQEPAAAALIRAYSIVLLLEALVSIGTVHFEKRLLLQKQFAFAVSGAVVDFVVAVSVAAAFKTVWAFVAGAVLGKASRLLASYMLQEFRPRVRIKADSFRQLYRYAGWMWVSTALWFLLLQGDHIFVGRMLGVTALGIYAVAFSLGSIIRMDLASVLQRVMFPMLTVPQIDPTELRRGYLRLLRGTALCVLPISVYLATLAPDIVAVLLGPRWAAAAPVLTVLALLVALHVFLENSAALLRAIGKNSQAIAGEAIFLAVAAALIFPLAAKLHLVGVAWAMLIGGAAGWAWAERAALAELKISLRELGQAVESSVAGTLVMLATFYLLRGLFPRAGWISLAAMTAGSGIMYLLTLAVAGLSRRRMLKASAAGAGASS